MKAKLPAQVRQLKLVFVEWLDSNYRAGWTSEAVQEVPAELMRCFSIGWLLNDGKDTKTISANVSADLIQRCCDMEIPTRAIVRMQVLR